MAPRRQGLRAILTLLIFFLAPTLQAQEDLQTYLRSLLRGRRGAVVVSNPGTGQVLAVWHARTAFEEAFPPGSAAKLVASAAALEEGVLSPSDQIFCRRIPELLGSAYHCSHPEPDGPFTLASALANSCNYFFAELAGRLSSAALAHWYAVFGFGMPGGQEAAGQVRIPTDGREKALAVLGERSVTATPAQLLLAYSALAMHGRAFRLERSSGHENPPSLLRRVRLQPRTYEVLEAGLEECVHSGTCQAAAVAGVRVAGKTGTATALDGSGVTHAWFVGYAPVGSPEVALVVFLERGTGMHDAAPLAGQILNYYFGRRSHQP